MMAIENPYGVGVEVVNRATGFRWEGTYGTRWISGSGCCNGLEEEVVRESQVFLPALTPGVTPSPDMPVAIESVEVRMGAATAAWDYIEKNHPGQIPDKGLSQLEPKLQVTPVSDRLEAFGYSDLAGWTLAISTGEPPYQVIVADESGGFRWEGHVSTPVVDCRIGICSWGYRVMELPTTSDSSQQ